MQASGPEAPCCGSRLGWRRRSDEVRIIEWGSALGGAKEPIGRCIGRADQPASEPLAFLCPVKSRQACGGGVPNTPERVGEVGRRRLREAAPVGLGKAAPRLQRLGGSARSFNSVGDEVLGDTTRLDIVETRQRVERSDDEGGMSVRQRMAGCPAQNGQVRFRQARTAPVGPER